MWGGRFKKKIDEDFDAFQRSIHYDYRLAKYDIYHSMIHVFALYHTKILTPNETHKLYLALKKILKEWKKQRFQYNPLSEDIHTEIQNRLEKKLKDSALKLQSYRSRNDQIIFDEKWYCIDEGVEILGLINEVIGSLEVLVQKYKKNFFIGYTHTQRAQIITFFDYISSFGWMLLRDFERLHNFLKELKIYVGSGALAGSYVKREDYDKAIKKFVKQLRLPERSYLKISLSENPLDNISNRDFIIEFLNILSILQMHLSRLSEDFILYSTREFNFFVLPEEFSTGSSLMPHKKNPDFLELVRGYTGRIYGNLMAVLNTMKGLPLTYNRDMQLDKEPLFSSIDIIKDELKIFPKLIKKIKLNKKLIEKILEKDESLYATELAEYLIEEGVPYKKAHKIIGKLISYSEQKKQEIKNMDDRLLKTFHPALNSKEIRKRLNPKFVIGLKRSVKRRSPRIRNNARV